MPKTLEQAARELGEKGAPPTEAERILFEAWMFGHCWEVTGAWNGKTYVCASESSGYCDPEALRTRQLWAAWRDRAALTADEGMVSVPREPTREMVQAGYAAMRKNATAEQLIGMTCEEEIYRAMLTAAEKELKTESMWDTIGVPRNGP